MSSVLTGPKCLVVKKTSSTTSCIRRHLVWQGCNHDQNSAIFNKRRRFTPEFRLGPVQLVLDLGYSVNEAAVVMGVGKSTMGKWVNKLRKERKVESPQTQPDDTRAA